MILQTSKSLDKLPYLKAYMNMMRLIPARSYWIAGCLADHINGTFASVTSFQLGATPVTWGVWYEYILSVSVIGKAREMPDTPAWGIRYDHPVVSVSWDEIMKPGGFCDWASSVAGARVTLPTDIQWEYAVRGGEERKRYPWGDDFDRSLLWCSSRANGDRKSTAPVVRKDNIFHNGYGLTDMVGNVSEWCSDYNYDPYSIVNNKMTGKRTTRRNARGGAWYWSDQRVFRCDWRLGDEPTLRHHTVGFRLAKLA
jgi:sulfatase modifying factor 1